MRIFIQCTNIVQKRQLLIGLTNFNQSKPANKRIITLIINYLFAS